MELLLPLLADLPLASILALSSTCRSLRKLITNPFLLDQVLNGAIMSGSLRWLHPVDSLPGNERERAGRSFSTWLHKSVAGNLDDQGVGADRDDDSDIEGCWNHTGEEDPMVLLTSPDFPRLTFIRACWDSDSMMNRKRLWGQVKQFEVLWKEYRTNGWQDPVFYPSGG